MGLEEEPTRRNLEAELRDAVEQQRATAAVMQILSRSRFDQAAVFKQIVDSALRLCEADNASLALFESRRARVAANAGQFRDEAGYNAAFGDIPLEPEPDTIVGRILLEKRTLSVADLRGSGLRRAPGPATGARSVLATPLLRDDVVLGTLIVRRTRPEPFAERHAHLLETFAAQAVIAIENTRLFRTIKRQSDELSRFVSPQVAELMTSEDGIRLLEGHRRQITAVSCQLRGFALFSQTTEPEEVLRVLRSYHATVGKLILEHRGTLEHFAGEGILVFFNDPVPLDDHERSAVALAIAIREQFMTLAAVWKKRGYDLAIAIGVAAGYATLGRIGFEGRYDYGAIGTVVLTASRLAAEAQPGQILISDRVQAAVEKVIEATAVGPLALSGLKDPVRAFDVIGLTPT